MNVVETSAKNFLYYSVTKEESISDILKICADLVKDGYIVLLFSRKHQDLTSLLIGFDKDVIQNKFFVSYQSDVTTVIDKLLELHDWSVVPDRVMLNLNSFFEDDNCSTRFNTICLCISALISYMRCVQKRKRDANLSGDGKSLTLLNGYDAVQLQLLVDFYFYKSAVFNEIQCVREQLLNDTNCRGQPD